MAHNTTSGSGFSKEREILVVDDDKILTLLHKKQLQGQPHPVSVHFNGKTALNLIEESSCSNFLVLLDLHMPVMNGWEFLEAVNKRDQGKNIKVLIVSSSITPDDKQKALNYPLVIDYFVKPFTRENLARLKEHREIRDFFEEEVESAAPLERNN